MVDSFCNVSPKKKLLRKDLSAIETIETTIDIIDMEMGKIDKALTAGKTPLERAHKLPLKLHSIGVSKDRGSQVNKEAEALLNKFVQQLAFVFDTLPNPLKWQSFLMQDLKLLTDIPLMFKKSL